MALLYKYGSMFYKQGSSTIQESASHYSLQQRGHITRGLRISPGPLVTVVSSDCILLQQRRRNARPDCGYRQARKGLKVTELAAKQAKQTRPRLCDLQPMHSHDWRGAAARAAHSQCLQPSCLQLTHTVER